MCTQQRWERGGTPERPPQKKSEKLLQKSGVIFHQSILSERSKKSEKYLVKNCKKSQFSIEILIKKSQNFLENFQNSLRFWSKLARFCKHAQFYRAYRNHSSDLDYLAFFYKVQSIFSKNFKNIHAIFNSPSLSKLFFEVFS